MHASLCCHHQRFSLAVLAVIFGLTAAETTVSAQQPLHQKINQTVSDTTIGPVAEPVDDLTFLRRVYLDLVGRIPSIEETRAFIADSSPDRRTKVVDGLLATKESSRNLATKLNVMLMERRQGKHIKADEIQAWFLKAVEANKPFHHIASELVIADTSPENRASAAFLLERDVEPNLVTREISRMFFGRDLQCAQCHDHPNVDDYKQEEYYGLYSFVNRSSLFQPDKKKPAAISESASGQSPFKSVFTDREAFTLPRLPGEAEFSEPVFAAGEEYLKAPAKNVAGIPKYSRRAKLAQLIATGKNDYFRRNIANRLWAMVMGRGLVHPVDMHHSVNPPSNPELMNLLADEIAAMDFNIKGFLRELVLTDIYRRAHLLDDTPSPNSDQIATAIADLEKRKSAALETSTAKVTEAEEALEKLDEVIATAAPVRTAWIKARTATTAAIKKRDDSKAALQAKQKPYVAKKGFADKLAESLSSVERAAGLLADSKELAALTAALRKQSASAAAESKKLQQAVEAAEKASTAAVAAYEKARDLEQAEQAKLTPLQETIRKQRAVLVKAWKDSERVYEQVSSAEVKVEFLTYVTTSTNVATKIPDIAAGVEKTRQQHQEMGTESRAAAASLASSTKAMTDQESRLQQVKSRTAELRARMQTAEKAGQLLSEAMAQASSAATTLSNDAAVTEVSSDVRRVAGRVNGMIGETQAKLESANKDMQATEKLVAESRAKVVAARDRTEKATAKVAELDSQLTTLRKQLSDLQATQDDAHGQIVERSTRQFQVATVEPLSPEQLAMSILQASGQIDRQMTANVSKFERALLASNSRGPAFRSAPPIGSVKVDVEGIVKELGTKYVYEQAEDATAIAMAKAAASLTALFAAQKGQPQDDFFATVDQALFFANGSQMRGWFAPSGTNLIARLMKLKSADEVADELYLSLLVRKPTAAEIQDVAEYLKARGEKRSEAVQELAWALVTSAEFRFHY